MDKGEVLLKPGDILVQRGTNHSWSVRTNEPCVLAAVLVNAKPVGGKGKRKAAAKKKAPAKKSKKKAAKKKGRR